MGKRFRNIMIACLIIVLAVGITPDSFFIHSYIRAQAAGSTKNQKALTAYKKMLSKSTYNWSDIQEENLTKNMSFAVLDINKDGVKELLLENNAACYASGYDRIFTYQNNKAKCIFLTGDLMSFYTNKSLMYDEGAHTGGYWDTYYQISKSGTLINKAYREGTDMKDYVPKGVSPVKVKDSDGFIIYYYKFQVNGKSVNYKKYKAAVKSLMKGAKKTKVTYHKNTAANRNQYLR